MSTRIFFPFLRRTHLLRTLIAILVSAPMTLLAAGFPTRALTLVVPYPPGGATDTVARIMAKGMSKRLGQAIIVESKAGAGTLIGAGFVARAAPDGYTLLISSNTTFTITPALRAKLPYNPIKSFESLGILGGSPLVLLANPELKAQSVRQLVALAKAQPGKLSYASFGAGTTSNFAGEMFKVMAGVNILHVPYNGSAPEMQALIGGQVQLSFDTNIAAIPQIRAGKVRALAVTSARRSPSLPKVPTLAESGYPDYEMVPWISIVAPNGLPDPVRTRLDQAVVRTLSDPTIRAALERAGVDVAYQPPAAYVEKVTKELPVIRAYVHLAGMTVE